jgi:hypothetical protein
MVIYPPDYIETMSAPWDVFINLLNTDNKYMVRVIYGSRKYLSVHEDVFAEWLSIDDAVSLYVSSKRKYATLKDNSQDLRYTIARYVWSNGKWALQSHDGRA